MNRQGLYNIFQLINALYEFRSVILTTNKDFTNWGEFFRDENVAVPIETASSTTHTCSSSEEKAIG